MNWIIFGAVLFASFALLIPSVYAQEIYNVDDDNGPYYTINSAVQVAEDGDWINVYGGDYNERVFVNKRLTFTQWEDEENGEIEVNIYGGGHGEEQGFFIGTSKAVKIHGDFRIIGCDYGIFSHTSTNEYLIQIYGITVENAAIAGIHIEGSQTVNINHCSVIDGSGDGIVLKDIPGAEGRDPQIGDSRIESNEGHGIFLDNVKDLIITRNHIWKNGMCGITMGSNVEFLWIRYNDIRENALYGVRTNYQCRQLLIYNNNLVENNLNYVDENGTAYYGHQAYDTQGLANDAWWYQNFYTGVIPDHCYYFPELGFDSDPVAEEYPY